MEKMISDAIPGSIKPAMVRTGVFMFTIIAFFKLNAQQTVQVGLLRNDPPQAVWLTAFKGTYTLTADTVCLENLVSTDALRLEATTDNRVMVSSAIRRYGIFTAVYVTGNDTLSEFKLKQVGGSKEKSYFGDLTITAGGNRLTLVNSINIDEYVAAVVESESGLGHTIEYYKVQAIISRTYAMSNEWKHMEDEGFNLCDNTHCQMYRYKGKSNVDIMRAVKETAGMVMVDDSLHLITTTFHSNCGGQTAASEQVWTKPLPYLRSVYDPYCRKSLNAVWTREIDKQTWLSYFHNTYGIDISTSVNVQSLTVYQSAVRKAYLVCAGKHIAFKNLRTDWNLKSAFFSIHLAGEKVVLEGRGFGHGVGLCQEGAMKMAKSGKSYRHILMHYFTGVHLVNLKELPFYAEE